MFYGFERLYQSLDELEQAITDYIFYYNNKRIKTNLKRLGHASSQMTLDTYSHATQTGEKQSIARFAEYIDKAK
ncbi:IS3 family transposase [Streptococcus ovuberis]|uniref:IS3 family transposase n=2 Tax=Streptococcus ovuberis TaxID=1936207 RepID=A0A7X6N127_9STRE|nr:IS3 family transposase [Streptococcus ovuberis]